MASVARINGTDVLLPRHQSARRMPTGGTRRLAIGRATHGLCLRRRHTPRNPPGDMHFGPFRRARRQGPVVVTLVEPVAHGPAGSLWASALWTAAWMICTACTWRQARGRRQRAQRLMAPLWMLVAWLGWALVQMCTQHADTAPRQPKLPHANARVESPPVRVVQWEGRCTAAPMAARTSCPP